MIITITFDEILEKITEKLTEADEDTISYMYTQLFDEPIQFLEDDTWEIEVDDAYDEDTEYEE